jgi:asparagine synthase (glutamine-hydrolysing)
MCGVAGYCAIGGNWETESPRLANSLEIMAHRGPDDRGVWHSRSHGVGLGMVRLAIQDLSSAGHQPMVSEDGRYVLVYNGEIYNFQALARDLALDALPLHSRTDTEVLLRFWQREGAACLNRLNGMFAFAVYDTREQTLHLVRDRFGIKPLYVAETPGGWVFASELKGLLPWAREGRLSGWRLNTEVLEEYMLFRHVSGRQTLVHGVQRVWPGEHWVLKAGRPPNRCLWYDLNERAMNLEPPPGTAYNENASLEELEGLLSDAIRLRMISDVPVGISLSGGVDSSLITCLLRRQRQEPIQTVSIVFDDPAAKRDEMDESPYSQWIADACQTDHHPIPLKEQAFCDLYPHCAWLNDEPLNFPNSLAVHLFSRVARPRATVLLGGEGADEVFGGYAFFGDRGPLTPTKHAIANPEQIRALVRAPAAALNFHRAILSLPLQSEVKKEMLLCMHTYLQTVENRLDKMSMGASLEFRVPFLDYRVVEASLRMPESALVGPDGTTKRVVKRLAEAHMPHQQIYRKKLGLSTPLNAWMANPERLGGWLKLLREPRHLDRPHVRPDGVLNLLRDHASREDTPHHSMTGRLWMLLNLEIWQRMFLEDMAPRHDFEAPVQPALACPRALLSLQ